MQLTALNWFIIFVGVLLCFAGILFKKLFEAILGFIWGFATTFLIMLFMALAGAEFLLNMEDASWLIVLIIVGTIVAVLALYLERLLITIQAFVISL